MKREKPVTIKEPKPKVDEVLLKEAEPLRWKKVGGGSLRILGMIIKPNQVFTAKLDDIPEGFRNVVVCLDKEEMKKQITAGKIIFANKEDLYGIEEVGKTGLYNIINTKTRKPLTKKPQSKSEAVILASSLNG